MDTCCRPVPSSTSLGFCCCLNLPKMLYVRFSSDWLLYHAYLRAAFLMESTRKVPVSILRTRHMTPRPMAAMRRANVVRLTHYEEAEAAAGNTLRCLQQGEVSLRRDGCLLFVAPPTLFVQLAHGSGQSCGPTFVWMPGLVRLALDGRQCRKGVVA